jgi:hypothetical protein
MSMSMRVAWREDCVVDGHEFFELSESGSREPLRNTYSLKS